MWHRSKVRHKSIMRQLRHTKTVASGERTHRKPKGVKQKLLLVPLLGAAGCASRGWWRRLWSPRHGSGRRRTTGRSLLAPNRHRLRRRRRGRGLHGVLRRSGNALRVRVVLEGLFFVLAGVAA